MVALPGTVGPGHPLPLPGLPPKCGTIWMHGSLQKRVNTHCRKMKPILSPHLQDTLALSAGCLKQREVSPDRT